VFHTRNGIQSLKADGREQVNRKNTWPKVAQEHLDVPERGRTFAGMGVVSFHSCRDTHAILPAAAADLFVAALLLCASCGGHSTWPGDPALYHVDLIVGDDAQAFALGGPT
jgi:hypothetical protein